jgi:hypothetical protein
MRRILVSAAAAALLATSSLAFAANQTTEGTVKSYNGQQHQIVLADGTTYSVPASFKDPGLKAGTKVKLTWDMQNGQRMANDVAIAQ